MPTPDPPSLEHDFAIESSLLPGSPTLSGLQDFRGSGNRSHSAIGLSPRADHSSTRVGFGKREGECSEEMDNCIPVSDQSLRTNEAESAMNAGFAPSSALKEEVRKEAWEGENPSLSGGVSARFKRGMSNLARQNSLKEVEQVRKRIHELEEASTQEPAPLPDAEPHRQRSRARRLTTSHSDSTAVGGRDTNVDHEALYGVVARTKTSALSAAESSPVVGLDSPVGQTGMRGLLRRTGTGLGVFRQERRASKEDVATKCGDAIEVNRHGGFASVEGARERLQIAESNVKKLTMGVNAFWSVFNNEKTEAEKRKKNKEMLIDNLLDAMYQQDENVANQGEGEHKLKGLQLFKRHVRRVIVANRMANNLSNNMSMYHRREKQRKNAAYFTIFHEDSQTVIVLRLFLLCASISDVCVMMVEAIGFHGCREECIDHGGPFEAATKDMMGHLGPTFYHTRIVLGLMSDLIYILYMAVRARTKPQTTVFGEDNLGTNDILRRYVRGDLIWDLFRCAPVYWLFSVNPWVRSNRVLNLFVTGWRSERIAKMLLSIHVKANVKVVQVLQFMVILLVYVHVMTCLTVVVSYAVCRQDGDANDVGEDEIRRWFDLQNADGITLNNCWTFYLHVSLWVWSLVSGWGGNWSPHSPVTSSWTWMNMFLGVFLYMYLLGGMVNLLQTFDLNASEFASHRHKIDTFLKLREVPPEMQLRVHTYLDHVWTLKHGVEEREVLESLPAFIRHDLAWFLNQQFLAKIPMFFGADTSALLEVNRHLTINVATVDEYINRRGELGHDMHFVLSGEINVLDEVGHVQLQLFEGAIIGEVCVIFEIPSPFDARVKAIAMLFTLGEDKFDEIITQFPALAHRIETRGRAVYGEKWSEWSDLADRLDRGEVAQSEGQSPALSGNVECRKPWEEEQSLKQTLLGGHALSWSRSHRRSGSIVVRPSGDSPLQDSPLQGNESAGPSPMPCGSEMGLLKRSGSFESTTGSGLLKRSSSFESGKGALSGRLSRILDNGRDAAAMPFSRTSSDESVREMQGGENIPFNRGRMRRGSLISRVPSDGSLQRLAQETQETANGTAELARQSERLQEKIEALEKSQRENITTTTNMMTQMLADIKALTEAVQNKADKTTPLIHGTQGAKLTQRLMPLPPPSPRS